MKLRGVFLFFSSFGWLVLMGFAALAPVTGDPKLAED